MAVEGWVDSAENGVAAGWAADMNLRDVPVALDVLLGGMILDRILASEYRADLVAHGFGRGRHGFSYFTPEGVDVRRLAFRPCGSTMPLKGSWFARRLDGRIDGISGEMISGWALDLDSLSASVEIIVFLDEVQIGVGVASDLRPDVARLFGGPGRTGFNIILPIGADQSKISVREASSGIALQPGNHLAERFLPQVGSFDGLAGSVAIGWAYDAGTPGVPAVVDFYAAGRLVGSMVASSYRPDVEAVGFGDGRAGFRAELDLDPAADAPAAVTATLRRTGRALDGSPRQFEFPVLAKSWLARADRATGPLLGRLRRWCDFRAGDTRLSIVMPIYETPEEWLREALDSVVAQWCGNWHLVCVDDASASPHVAAVLAEYAALDPRITVVLRARNGGIASAVNAGLAAAHGDYVAFMDHDDILEPDACHWLLRGAASGADLVYSDEIVTGVSATSLMRLVARPAFSYDYYLSHPYFVHLVCVRRSLAEAVGGWDESMSISGDVDFVLRVLERAGAVAHVAAPLYRWRTHPGSAGHAAAERVMEATKGALQRHLKATGWAATVSDGPSFNQFRVDWPDDGRLALVVVATRDRVDLLRPCLESLRATTSPDEVRLVVVDHCSTDPETVEYLSSLAGKAAVMRYEGPFNYPAINNAAVRAHGEGCGYVLLLNNDVEATEAGWLGRMRSLARRPDVGAVGAVLLYPDGTVQHAGVIIGLNGPADHAHKFKRFRQESGGREPGYNGSLSSVREWSAATAACLMMRMEVFLAVGGLDEALTVGFNDTDLCLRIRAAGLKVLVDPFAVLLHKESATRAETREVDHPADTALFQDRWCALLESGDPFYNPALSLAGSDHELAEARGPGEVVRVTPVVLPSGPYAAAVHKATCGSAAAVVSTSRKAVRGKPARRSRKKMA